MKNRILLICTFVLIGTVGKLHAQEDRNPGIIWSSLRGLEYEIKAGFNVGGTSPLPLPEEIRALTGYDPLINLSIEGNVTKWLDAQKKWGVIVGIRLENKGMSATARTKNYSMEIIDGGSRLKGNWTGRVKTKVRNSYLTIPVLATYKLSPRVKVNAGPYFSYLTQGDFSGHVYDGYLRKDNPTGTKVEFKDGKIAPYDFSSDLRKFQWGMQLGADWRAFKHLSVSGNLNWGLNDIFKKDFDTITFAMYPIYFNVGFGYAF
ncbi:MAG TPA: PorT family protein [Bacteroides reticulotermitis]|nr:PorT family protein [Bacteroides reticulotermitis]